MHFYKQDITGNNSVCSYTVVWYNPELDTFMVLNLPISKAFADFLSIQLSKTKLSKTRIDKIENITLLVAKEINYLALILCIM